MANPLPLSALGRLMVNLLPAGYPGMEQNAARLRLGEGGLICRELIAAVRFLQGGRRLLNDATIHLEDVADRLGFAGPGRFSGAFRRWSGVSLPDVRRPRSLVGRGVSCWLSRRGAK